MLFQVFIFSHSKHKYRGRIVLKNQLAENAIVGNTSSFDPKYWPPRAETVDWRVAFVKRFIDILGSTLLLVLISPILLAVAAALKLDASGPVFFVQRRVGRGGLIFGCYKFRTMVPDAELMLAKVLEDNADLSEEWGKNQKLKNDPRVTRLGSFLRSTSLDELPQLLNVAMGQMSLVGPRPALPEQLIAYGRGARWYCAVRPGVTGLWQVKARGNSHFGLRVALDCYYVRQLSILTDLGILIQTISVVISRRGAS